MADISKINLNGTSYTIKDDTARDNIEKRVPISETDNLVLKSNADGGNYWGEITISEEDIEKVADAVLNKLPCAEGAKF